MLEAYAADRCEPLGAVSYPGPPLGTYYISLYFCRKLERRIFRNLSLSATPEVGSVIIGIRWCDEKGIIVLLVGL
jgi:hypothetical protein